ncbi:MAG: FAD:protein FMN transferase [Aestuariibacter sp.]
MILQRLIHIAAITLAIWLLVACTQAPGEVHLSGRTMGTTYNIKYPAQPAIDPVALQSLIDAELQLVNKLMSTYDPQSELSVFNQTKSTEPQSLSDATLLVISEALKIGEMSDGYLDITVGPLVNLWGFGPNAKPETIPTPQQVQDAHDIVGLDKLVTGDSTASKIHPDVYVDLSTVAKGYGVDQVALLLEQQGLADYLVEIGGEMRVAGKKANGSNWRIAIEKPVTLTRAVQRIVTIGDNAIATAGDYRNYFEENGVRYSHLIDPKTGYPINHRLVAATVVHPSSLVADGLATALVVMGKDKGLAMAEREGLSVLLITRENNEFKEYTTAGFDQYLNN